MDTASEPGDRAAADVSGPRQNTRAVLVAPAPCSLSPAGRVRPRPASPFTCRDAGLRVQGHSRSIGVGLPAS